MILTFWKVNLSNSRTGLEIRLNKKKLITRLTKIHPDSQCCSSNYMLTSVRIWISSLFQWKINIRNFQEGGGQRNLRIMAKFTKMPRYILGKLWVFQEIVIPIKQKLFSTSGKVLCSILSLICPLFQIVPVNRNQINPARNSNIQGTQQRCSKTQAEACPTPALQIAGAQTSNHPYGLDHHATGYSEETGVSLVLIRNSFPWIIIIYQWKFNW